MGLFPKRKIPPPPNETLLQSVTRQTYHTECDFSPCTYGFYRRLRTTVPVIDAAIQKIIRLCGGFQLMAEDPRLQEKLDQFVRSVPVGATGSSLQTFIDGCLDSLLTCGNALGEILVEEERGIVTGLQNHPPELVSVQSGAFPNQRTYLLREADNTAGTILPHPERIIFTALAPPPGKIYGVSVLHGLPALSRILLRIYECIGQNYDRIGNVRYAVTYRPGNDPTGLAYASERTKQIAEQWTEGMRAGARGEVRDFVCSGDVDIKVIGSENTLLNTEIPVRQLLEQLLAKLSIPPFLLGLNWSSTERMSSQQADILTSELEYYRRLLEPILIQVGRLFLGLCGFESDVTVQWENINLQDETELAQARLWNAQAAQIEANL